MKGPGSNPDQDTEDQEMVEVGTPHNDNMKIENSSSPITKSPSPPALEPAKVQV